MKENILIDSDSYKSSHWMQYPPNTTYMHSYLESRGGKYSKTLWVGLQGIIKQYLLTPITNEMVDEANAFFLAHGEPFNVQGWRYIVNELGGKLPVRIRAIPEGAVVDALVPLMTVESTDPKCFWVVSWLETMLMRVWYPSTVATQSFYIKKLIMSYLEETSDNAKAEIDFKLHDFGSRGVSSQESAAIGGAAHLVNFKGSDTVVGVRYANKYYNCPMAGFSIPAAEHSTMTMWGREHEADAYRNMIKTYGKPGALFAVVSDSYDIYNAVSNIWGDQLRGEVIDSGATLVVRPDSGNPPEVVLNTLQLLEEKFGSTYNSKNYRVLNHVRVIQGDGINQESIRAILELAKQNGYSATNIAFGMGGALLQQVNRDTQNFAFKCSYAVVDGVGVDVFKDPVTDHGKRSKKGKLDTVYLSGTFQAMSGQDNFGSVMKVIYENGVLLKEYTLDDVRRRASEF